MHPAPSTEVPGVSTTTLIDQDPVDQHGTPDVELLFREARRRARRRKMLLAGSITVMASATSVTLLLIASSQGSSTSDRIALPQPRTAIQVTKPNIYVVHTPTKTGIPGLVNVMDSATGQLIRTIGSAYDPYSMTSFQVSPDLSTMFYGQLNEMSQNVDLVVASTDGRTSTVIPDAGNPLLSPDGRYLEYSTSTGEGLHIKDLTSGELTTIKTPTVGWDNLGGSLSWLPDSQHLLLAGSPAEFVGIRCAPQLTNQPFPSCPIVTPAAAIPKAMILELMSKIWTTAPQLQDGDGRYGTLLGPGSEPGTVLAMPNDSLSPAPLADGTFTPATLLTVDTTTGSVITRATIPDQTRVLSADTSGTNIPLLDSRQSTATLTSWQPLTGVTVALGPRVDEATW